MFYGIIERQITLDYIISKYSSKPLDKIDKDVLSILRIGIYQLLYMSSIPDNAAVNETVNLAKQAHKASASGFVNAVLRNFIRDNKKIILPKDKTQAYSIEYSCPLWLVDKWIKEYGEKKEEYCYILKIYKLIVETIKDIKNLAKEILENF